MHGRGEGHAWQGACKAGGSMHGRGHARQGTVCMAGGMVWGAHVVVAGGMHGRGVHGRGVCGRGACVAGETATAAGSTQYASYWNAFLSLMFKFYLLLES